MYFDTTYIAKFYLNEPGSDQVRALARTANGIHSSLWALAEFHAVLSRYVRENGLSRRQALEIASLFGEHVGGGLWVLAPIRESILQKAGTKLVSAPKELFVRAADAVHLTTAYEIGEHDVWTNDRHMLAAAAYFGVRGHSV